MPTYVYSMSNLQQTDPRIVPFGWSLQLSTRESREDVKDMSRGPIHRPPIVPLLVIRALRTMTVVWFVNVEYTFVLVYVYSTGENRS